MFVRPILTSCCAWSLYDAIKVWLVALALLSCVVSGCRDSRMVRFIKQLKDADPDRRAKAALSLGSSDDDFRSHSGTIIEEMLSLLDDPDARVRHAALLSIGRIADRDGAQKELLDRAKARVFRAITILTGVSESVQFSNEQLSGTYRGPRPSLSQLP